VLGGGGASAHDHRQGDHRGARLTRHRLPGAPDTVWIPGREPYHETRLDVGRRRAPPRPHIDQVCRRHGDDCLGNTLSA
jgi:hypothetical protein